MNSLYHAKKTGTTERGSWYSILQDGPASFHISVSNPESKDAFLIYEHFQDPPSLEELEKNILQLEKELLDPKEPELLTSAEEVITLPEPQPEPQPEPEPEQTQGEPNGI